MKNKAKIWSEEIWKGVKTLFWSFRLHLFVLMLAVTMLPCILVKEMLLSMYCSQLISERGIEVRYSAQVLANQLGTASFLEGKVNDTILTEMTQLADIYSGRIMLINRQYRVVEDTYFIYQDKICVANDVFTCFKGEGTLVEDRKAGYMRYTIPITLSAVSNTDTGSTNTETIGVMVVTVSISSLMDLVDSMRDKANVLLLTIFIVAGAAAFMLSDVYTRPFQKMLKNLSQVEDGNLDRTLEPHGFDITRKTTETVNKMLVQLQELDKSRQEFVSNVSHELKTPITSIRVLADSLMLQEDVPVELYREFMGDISEEIEWETHIINDLLALVKMDRGASMNVEKVNINNFLEVILRRLKPIAQKRDIEMILELFRPVSAMVDETKLSLAVTNLVENAIKYNNDGGRVRVILNADHKYFYLTVEDNGVGIPDDAIDHIFDRFYRVDKARSREAGGTGLGLAITKSVIQMHGGTIRVESALGQGTTFSVRIPLKNTTVKEG